MAKKNKKPTRPAAPAAGAPKPAPPPKPAPKTRAKPKWRQTAWYRGIRDVVVVVGLFVVIRLWILEANVIPSGSMEDTLLVGDHIIAEKVTYHVRDPRPGEIVTFTFPYRDMTAWESVRFFLRHFLGELPQGPTLLIKRVQGAPGDVLELKRNVLYRNGRPVEERYLKGGAGADWGPYTVPTGYVFVMGDNRYDSFDSRFIGPVPRKYVMGKAAFIYFSLSPVNCAKHHAPVVRLPDGWYCEAGGEKLRPGLDFEPTSLWRFDRRIRWDRMGKICHLLR